MDYYGEPNITRVDRDEGARVNSENENDVSTIHSKELHHRIYDKSMFQRKIQLLCTHNANFKTQMFVPDKIANENLGSFSRAEYRNKTQNYLLGDTKYFEKYYAENELS